MSDIGANYKKINELDATSAALSTDITVIEKSAGSVEKMTLAQLITLVSSSGFEDLTLSGPTPSIVFRDNNASDTDNNATIAVNLTDTGSGTEDADVTMSAQVAGSDANYLAVTASNNSLVLGSGSAQLLGFYGEGGANKAAAMTTADAVALDATYDVTEQTTLSNIRIRVNEIEAILQAVSLVN